MINEPLEYQTCTKCKIQQPRKTFLYGSSAQTICKYCNKKTKIIPQIDKTSTQDVLTYLKRITFDPKSETSVFFQTQMDPVFTWLQRKHCKEIEKDLN